jgi:general stress protein CsbA
MIRADSIKWNPELLIAKFDPDQVAWGLAHTGHEPTGPELEALGMVPELLRVKGNLLTTAGLTRVVSLINAGGTQALISTSGRIGVGDSSTAAAVGQTDLQAATNKYWMTLTSCTVSGAVLTAVASFASGVANYAWAEWGIDIGAPTVIAGTTVNACLLNRKVDAMGTKASGSVWTATATITLS